MYDPFDIPSDSDLSGYDSPPPSEYAEPFSKRTTIRLYSDTVVVFPDAKVTDASVNDGDLLEWNEATDLLTTDSLDRWLPHRNSKDEKRKQAFLTGKCRVSLPHLFWLHDAPHFNALLCMFMACLCHLNNFEQQKQVMWLLLSIYNHPDW